MGGEVLPALNLEATGAAQGGDENDRKQQQRLVQRFPSRSAPGVIALEGATLAVELPLLLALPRVSMLGGWRTPAAGRRTPQLRGDDGGSTAGRVLPSVFSSSGAESRGAGSPARALQQVCSHGQKEDTQQLVSLLNEFIGF